MSVDLIVIIGHNLTLAEIISFPKFLTDSLELKQAFASEIKSKQDHSSGYLKYTKEDMRLDLQEEMSWKNVDETHIQRSWEINCDETKREDSGGYYTPLLNTYFGYICFNKKTVQITYFPEHKYANLYYQSHRSFILNFSRAMAKALGQTKIVYCDDTGPTSSIKDDSMEGKSIEQIISMTA